MVVWSTSNKFLLYFLAQRLPCTCGLVVTKVQQNWSDAMAFNLHLSDILWHQVPLWQVGRAWDLGMLAFSKSFFPRRVPSLCTLLCACLLWEHNPVQCHDSGNYKLAPWEHPQYPLCLQSRLSAFCLLQETTGQLPCFEKDGQNSYSQEESLRCF